MFFKGKFSILSYAVASIISLFAPIVGEIIYLILAFLWVIPDRRIRKVLMED